MVKFKCTILSCRLNFSKTKAPKSNTCSVFHVMCYSYSRSCWTPAWINMIPPKTAETPLSGPAVFVSLQGWENLSVFLPVKHEDKWIKMTHFYNHKFTVDEHWKEKEIFFNSRHLRVHTWLTKQNFAMKYHFKPSSHFHSNYNAKECKDST